MPALCRVLVVIHTIEFTLLTQSITYKLKQFWSTYEYTHTHTLQHKHSHTQHRNIEVENTN